MIWSQIGFHRSWTAPGALAASLSRVIPPSRATDYSPKFGLMAFSVSFSLSLKPGMHGGWFNAPCEAKGGASSCLDT
jgi:hypothetical protein